MANEPAPKLTKLADLLGQERALDAIRSGLSSGRIPSGWLFAGPRGVGKMTAALATAAAVNCGPAAAEDGGGLFGGSGGSDTEGPIRTQASWEAARFTVV